MPPRSVSFWSGRNWRPRNALRTTASLCIMSGSDLMFWHWRMSCVCQRTWSRIGRGVGVLVQTRLLPQPTNIRMCSWRPLGILWISEMFIKGQIRIKLGFVRFWSKHDLIMLMSLDIRVCSWHTFGHPVDVRTVLDTLEMPARVIFQHAILTSLGHLAGAQTCVILWCPGHQKSVCKIR